MMNEVTEDDFGEEYYNDIKHEHDVVKNDMTMNDTYGINTVTKNDTVNEE